MQIHYLWGQTAANRGTWPLLTVQRTSSKNPVKHVWLVRMTAGYFTLASSESCQPIGNLLDVGTKLKENIFQSNNQINSTVTTRT